jgi:hypothetical protein
LMYFKIINVFGCLLFHAGRNPAAVTAHLYSVDRQVAGHVHVAAGSAATTGSQFVPCRSLGRVIHQMQRTALSRLGGSSL